MNRYLLLSFLVLGVMSFGASAQNNPCGGNTRQNNLENLLPGKTVCATRGTDQWQEEHRGALGAFTGQLWDYKKGPDDPVDPSKELGIWTIETQGNNQRVKYTYTAFGGSESYTFTVHLVNGNGVYNFCGVGGASQDVYSATILLTNPDPNVRTCP